MMKPPDQRLGDDDWHTLKPPPCWRQTGYVKSRYECVAYEGGIEKARVTRDVWTVSRLGFIRLVYRWNAQGARPSPIGARSYAYKEVDHG